MINRENAEALISEQVLTSIFQDATQESTFMKLAHRLPNMSSAQTRIPVLDMLPMAYWVEGETEYEESSKQVWDNVYLNAAELAVIVPIPEAVISDASFDIIGEVKPRVMEAIGKCVDDAIIFGKNRPNGWSNDIITAARQAGNNVDTDAATDYYDAIMGEAGLLSLIEEQGFISTGAISSLSMRAKLRGLKDANGHPIFCPSMQGSTQYVLDGAPVYFPSNGSFDNSKALLVAGDWSQAVYSIRQDISVKILDQGVIQNPLTKEIEYNLAQQDMIALRVIFRMGWALPNPATRINNRRLGCPFAYLEPNTPETTYAVAITVTDDADEGIAGASINLNGSRKLADANGTAVFNLRDGEYPVKIKAEGYRTAIDSIAVNGDDVERAVTLIKA
jgi:HK97 family phage major capsid protein